MTQNLKFPTHHFNKYACGLCLVDINTMVPSSNCPVTGSQGRYPLQNSPQARNITLLLTFTRSKQTWHSRHSMIFLNLVSIYKLQDVHTYLDKCLRNNHFVYSLYLLSTMIASIAQNVNQHYAILSHKNNILDDLLREAQPNTHSKNKYTSRSKQLWPPLEASIASKNVANM